ncbi:MAG: hypothetical protein CMLOHMNK_01475 [Steroidobacteraceae bacterium]|nr:hypothetical protein [Steroidobacteraceae bacterium]
MTLTDPTFDAVSLIAKTLRCMVVVSCELAQDAPNIDAQLSALLQNALALELDRPALMGSGSGAEPLRLFGTSGISSVSMGDNGAAITNYDLFVDALTAIRAAYRRAARQAQGDGQSAVRRPGARERDPAARDDQHPGDSGRRHLERLLDRAVR